MGATSGLDSSYSWRNVRRLEQISKSSQASFFLMNLKIFTLLIMFVILRVKVLLLNTVSCALISNFSSSVKRFLIRLIVCQWGKYTLHNVKIERIFKYTSRVMMECSCPSTIEAMKYYIEHKQAQPINQQISCGHKFIGLN